MHYSLAIFRTRGAQLKCDLWLSLEERNGHSRKTLFFAIFGGYLPVKARGSRYILASELFVYVWLAGSGVTPRPPVWL